MFSKSDNIQDDLLKRIQSSENFYRIRDAEDKMIQQKQKLKKKLKLQEKNEKNGLKYVIQEDHASGAPSSIFTAHTLNKDPEVSKYLLFNEIIYPKISKDTTKSLKKRFPDPNGGLGASLGEGGSSDHLEMDPVEELEKMWVNGFIDRSIRDKDKMIGMKKNKKLKLLKPLMKDQYRSGVKNEDDDDDDATGSIQSNPSVSSSSGPSSSINEPKMSSIQSKKSLSSSCSSSSLSLPSRFDPSNELIKSKKLHRSDEKQANEALKAPSFEPDDATSSLSVNDKYRLKLLTNSIKNHQKQKKSTTSQTFLNSLKVYETQNRHMKQSSSSSMLNKQSNGPSIHSIELDAIFDVERIETLAAKKIQRAYIHSRLITKLRHVFHCMLMAVKIQKHIRGYLIRKRVAIWYQQKSILMIRWQCRIRKYLSNLHLKQQLYQEQHAVIRIQTIIRRKLAQIKIFKLRRNLAAIHIQALWRGCCARIKSDRLWLNKVVIPIQVLMRKMVSRLRYQSIKDERINAAITIQRSFRSWLSIQKLSTSLNNREDIYREYTLAMLTAEEEWADDTIIKLTHRLDKKEIREKLQLVNNDYQKTVEEIHYKENDLIELQRQKDILSARAIQQGWLAELEQNIITTRNEITALKMKLIFKKHVLLNSLETQLENKVQEIEKVGRYRNKIADYRDQEIEDNRVRDFYRNTTKIRKNKRQAIAHERRKWMIHFYTPNGKPDKLRRPGRKWEPEAYAGPDKMTYCSASGVDLFAMNKQHSKGAGIKEGSQESIEQKLNEVTLHTYLQQVQEYETLLNPLFKIMQSSLGGEPTSKLPSEAGWGPIGEKLPEALEKIDAIPGEWKEQRVEYRRNEAMKLQEIQRKKQLEEEERLLREKERQLLLSQTDGLSEFNQFFDQDGEIMEEQPSQPPPPSSSSSTKKNMRAMPSTMSNKYVTFSPTTSPNKNLLKVSTKDTTSKSSILTSPTKGKSLSIEEKERIEKRKKRVRERSVGAASIPWTLLDELDGEKKKFENEKNYLEFYHKF